MELARGWCGPGCVGRGIARACADGYGVRGANLRAAVSVCVSLCACVLVFARVLVYLRVCFVRAPLYPQGLGDAVLQSLAESADGDVRRRVASNHRAACAHHALTATCPLAWAAIARSCVALLALSWDAGQHATHTVGAANPTAEF